MTNVNNGSTVNFATNGMISAFLDYPMMREAHPVTTFAAQIKARDQSLPFGARLPIVRAFSVRARVMSSTLLPDQS